jgi:hypothetical protein
LEHITDLPADKQFHFASRLYLWNKDAACKKILDELRPWFAHDDNPAAALQDVAAEAAASPVHGSKNAADLRRPFFERYPNLKAYVSVLFRITFLQTIYGIDCHALFYELFAKEDAEQLVQDLLADPDALRILSTHAVNFLYLYNGIIKGNTSAIGPSSFLSLREGYDLAGSIQLQLFIYLYTHCIIGESLFYYRALPTERLEIYRSMVIELEQLLETRFEDVNLDGKCEFLVSCSLVGHTSPLASLIYTEAAQSLSLEGSFLIDRHNNNPQTANITLDTAEHRNVLFILSQNAFRPSSSDIALPDAASQPQTHR